jgi:membrane protease YdiL (CAAX protease family)
VLAVLAIGVFPYLSSAIVVAVHGAPADLPYWLDALDLGLRSACVSYATLYVIHRSSEPWSSFGMPRPGHSDLWLGLLIFILDYVLWARVAPLLPADVARPESLFPVPQGARDYLPMAVKYAANGFAEELVTRAYLITRLERLLKSGLQAVALSALLFASYHVYYGFGGWLIYVLVLGLVFGGLYLLLRRVWPLALAHMLINVVNELERM